MIRAIEGWIPACDCPDHPAPCKLREIWPDKYAVSNNSQISSNSNLSIVPNRESQSETMISTCL